jgi:hypothetical protein
MADPNYLKTVAPKTAAAIRAAVNAHPTLSKIIQFNSIAGLAAMNGIDPGSLPIPPQPPPVFPQRASPPIPNCRPQSATGSITACSRLGFPSSLCCSRRRQTESCASGRWRPTQRPQKSDWGRHVASIPLNIINQWLNEEWARGNVGLRLAGPEFDAMVARKLRDPDWRFLRTDR